MTAIAWMLLGFGVFCAGFHVGRWWACFESQLAEQERAECRMRQKRIKWPANWGEG